ncbi:hypothetical protein ABMA57_08755 [Saccharospirillum sp. HFRX-1]|uniref:hypothetical protein n=1 Tax=unclassified Saccharospirillum TaxID=2633430 RepID=UPI00371E28BE
MRVDAGMSYQYMNQRPQVANNDSKTQASFADTLSTIKSNGPDDNSTNEVDFTSMTKKELFDWMNVELKAGRMSVEESEPFMLMAMDARITETGELVIESTPDDITKVNFVEKINDAIEGAKSRNDENNLNFLNLAKEVMDRYQKSIDVHA